MLKKSSKKRSKEVTNSELARMVAKGFANTATKSDIKRLDSRMDSFEDRMDGLDSRMDSFEDRMESMEKTINHMDARLGRVEADIHEMRDEIVYRHEFTDLMDRVKYLEKQHNIRSGN